MAKKVKRVKQKNPVEPIYVPKTNSVPLIGMGTANQVTEAPLRASESSYIFIQGHKVLVRNLTDEMLNDEYERTYNEAFEVRHKMNLLDSLQFNLSMEQKFRGLK